MNTTCYSLVSKNNLYELNSFPITYNIMLYKYILNVFFNTERDIESGQNTSFQVVRQCCSY